MVCGMAKSMRMPRAVKPSCTPHIVRRAYVHGRLGHTKATAHLRVVKQEVAVHKQLREAAGRADGDVDAGAQHRGVVAELVAPRERHRAVRDVLHTAHVAVGAESEHRVIAPQCACMSGAGTVLPASLGQHGRR